MPPDAPERDRVVVRGGMRAWVAAGVDLGVAVAPDGDADRLLSHPRCRLVKFQRKVVVGRALTPAGALWIKRYTVHAWRVALGSVGRASPAARAFATARALERWGFGVPAVVAAIEFRRFGCLTRSFFVTREVTDAMTADVRWAALAGQPAARHALARALGRLLAALHGAGVYHNDLKDVNVLVRGLPTSPELVLLDLERVAIGRDPGPRRRRKNLVQLERTLGRAATRAARLRVLDAYLGERSTRASRRAWAAAVLHAAAAKDRERTRTSPPPRRETVTCTVVCQDEAEQIGRCLESARWCDELLVVDGGSRDDTVAIAARHADRIIEHAWPGYRAQKQFALDHASGAWVLNLDADERVTAELASEIQGVLGAGVPAGIDGFRMPRLVSYLGRFWFRGGWYPRPVLRLVRRAHTVWGGTDPHDRPEVRGRVVSLSAPLLHYTYEDVGDHLRSVAKLTAVAARQVRAGRRVGLGRLAGEPAWRFFRAWIVKRGVLEGLPGFFVAATDAFYTFLRWARVRERERSCPPRRA